MIFSLFLKPAWAGEIIPPVSQKAETFPVHIKVLDESVGAPVHARAYLWREGRLVLPKGFSSYDKGSERHFLVPGEFTLDLQAGKYKIRVERGLEYLPAEASFEVEREISRTITLNRWVNLNSHNWYSADMHVHRDPKEMDLILLAEDLNFAPTITTHVWGRQIRRPWSSPADFPVKVDSTHIYTGNSQEIERIQGGPGAVILLAPDLPLGYSGYELYPPSMTYTRKTHARGGYVEADKPFWLDTFVNVALGEIDFIELNCNHFLPRDVQTDITRWSRWPLEMGYMGDHGFALWIMDLYYRILNVGFRLPLSAGSASGVKATPVGYNRIYVKLEEFTYDNFLKAMKEGKSFTTNGPVLDFLVNGVHGPGATLSLESEQKVQISASARSRAEIESMQVILNGKLVREYPGKGHKELRVSLGLDIEESAWIALRVFEKSQQSVVFGHTSPVYVIVNHRPILVPGDARDLMKRIDQLVEYTKQAKGFAEESHRGETLEVYRQARAVYERLANSSR